MSKSTLNNISHIVKEGMCTGCGTCVALCPREAIDMELNESKAVYLPVVDMSRCNGCGVCTLVCPGDGVDYEKMNQTIFGKSPDDIYVGNFINCYTGRGADPRIWQDATTGGLVTSLLIFALENKYIDGALVTGWSADNPLRPHPFIARSREELLAARKSKYCPVPANIALRDIIDTNGDERFAAVGLPCHMHGLRMAEAINKRLKRSIVLRLGLFCGSRATFKGTRLLLKKAGVRERDVVRLDYRTGWPGGPSIWTCKGERKFIPLLDALTYWGEMLNPMRCHFCCDGTAEMADISFGDAWLPRFVSEPLPSQIVVCRSQSGRSLLQAAMNVGAVSLSPAGPDDVVSSQKMMLYSRKRLSNAYLHLFGKVGIFPEAKLLKPGPVDTLLAIYQYLLRFYNFAPFTWVLERMPKAIIKLHPMPVFLGAQYSFFRQAGEGFRGLVVFILQRIKTKLKKGRGIAV